MHGAIVGMDEFVHVILPIGLVSFRKRLQHNKKSSVHYFNLSTALWVVQRNPRMHKST